VQVASLMAEKKHLVKNRLVSTLAKVIYFEGNSFSGV
jgi:hypothetical protein